MSAMLEVRKYKEIQGNTGKYSVESTQKVYQGIFAIFRFFRFFRP